MKLKTLEIIEIIRILEDISVLKENRGKRSKIFDCAVLLRQKELSELTFNAIASIQMQKAIEYKIFVLDDASESLAALSLFLATNDVEIIPLQSRAEYCLGFNILANYVLDLTTNIFIVNNDTRHYSANLLMRLNESLKKEKVGIASPRILDFNGDLLHWRTRNWMGFNLSIATEAYMISSKNWKTLGGFNASFFRYCEDIDLVQRLEALDMKQELVNEVSLEHLSGGSTKANLFIPVYFYSRNILWIQKMYLNSNLMSSRRSASIKTKELIGQKQSSLKLNRVRVLSLHLYRCLGLLSGMVTTPHSRLSPQEKIEEHMSRYRNRLRFKLR